MAPSSVTVVDKIVGLWIYQSLNWFLKVFSILCDKIPIYAHCVMLRFRNPFMARVWRLEMTDTSQNGALLQWTTSGWLWVLGASTTRSIAYLLLKDKLLKSSVVMKCRQVGTPNGSEFFSAGLLAHFCNSKHLKNSDIYLDPTPSNWLLTWIY